MNEPIDFDAPMIEAAGGIVERLAAEGIVVALVRRERYGQEWSLPKGKRDPGETWQQTALREVHEETGLQARITGIGGCTFYPAGPRPKIVVFWRMALVGAPGPFAPLDDETVELAWLTPAAAAERLTHAQEAEVLRSMFPELKSGPVQEPVRPI